MRIHKRKCDDAQTYPSTKSTLQYISLQRPTGCDMKVFEMSSYVLMLGLTKYI